MCHDYRLAVHWMIHLCAMTTIELLSISVDRGLTLSTRGKYRHNWRTLLLKETGKEKPADRAREATTKKKTAKLEQYFDDKYFVSSNPP